MYMYSKAARLLPYLITNLQLFRCFHGESSDVLKSLVHPLHIPQGIVLRTEPATGGGCVCVCVWVWVCVCVWVGGEYGGGNIRSLKVFLN